MGAYDPVPNRARRDPKKAAAAKAIVGNFRDIVSNAIIENQRHMDILHGPVSGMNDALKTMSGDEIVRLSSLDSRIHGKPGAPCPRCFPEQTNP